MTLLILLLSLAAGGGSDSLLVRDTTSMETAWDVPRDPTAVLPAGDSALAEQIRRGYGIFRETPKFARRFTASDLSCNNCHLNAGQRERALPIVGVAGAFPEYSKRSGRLISLEDRIVGCFARSENAAAVPAAERGDALSSSSPEVLALSAYITWLSDGFGIGEKLPWRGRNIIPREKIIPLEKLDRRRGESLYVERCSNCHGEDGQGVAIGDKKAGPLWGSLSWNDGAGAARVYTLAGMIRYAMPYVDPGSLTDEESQEIAAYICGKPRPAFPHKDTDYPGGDTPVDAVYYKK